MNDNEKIAAAIAGAVVIGAVITTATTAIILKMKPGKSEELMMALADESPAAIAKAARRIQKSA